mgnify:CR=1 FL=1
MPDLPADAPRSDTDRGAAKPSDDAGDGGRSRLIQLFSLGAYGFALFTIILGGTTMFIVSGYLSEVFAQIDAPMPTASTWALATGPKLAWAAVEGALLVSAGLTQGVTRVVLSIVAMGIGLVCIAAFVIAVYLPFFTFAAHVSEVQ